MAAIASPTFKSIMNMTGIREGDAELLYEYMDPGCTGFILSDDMFSNFVRLRSGAKFVDMLTLGFEFEELRGHFDEWAQRLEDNIQSVAKFVSNNIGSDTPQSFNKSKADDSAAACQKDRTRKTRRTRVFQQASLGLPQ